LVVACTHSSPAVIKDHTPGVIPTPASTFPRDETVSGEALRKLIKEDWLKYAEALRAARVPLTTQADAVGYEAGCATGNPGNETCRGVASSPV